MILTAEEVRGLAFLCPYCGLSGSISADAFVKTEGFAGKDAVRAFFRALSTSRTITKNYNTLTKAFLFGYDANKIVSFAAQQGFRFSVNDLEYVRLTNSKYGQRKHEGVNDVHDYSPTEFPKSPEDPELFREWHGRNPG